MENIPPPPALQLGKKGVSRGGILSDIDEKVGGEGGGNKGGGVMRVVGNIELCVCVGGCNLDWIWGYQLATKVR